MITPYREESEEDRKGRPPQNYRIEHPLKPKRPLWRKLLGRPERYYHPSVGYYEHMPASLVRDYVGEDSLAELFQIRLRPQSLGPAGLLVSLQDQVEGEPPELRALHGKPPPRLCDNHEIYMLDGALAVDFVGRYETLEDDLNKALQRRASQRSRRAAHQRHPQQGREPQLPHLLSPATEALVADWYQPEIALLGYGF